MKKICLFIGVILLSTRAFSQEERPSFLVSWWTWFKGKVTEKVIGANSDNKNKDEWTIPVIPKEVIDPKSTDVYTKKIDEKHKRKFSDTEMKTITLNFAKELFVVTFAQKINEKEWSNWQNVLLQGGSLEGMYHALVLGPVYEALISYPYSTTDELASFSISFLEKFVQKTYSFKELKAQNPYFIKRLVVEKALDACDKLKFNEESFSVWVSLLSSFLAESYPDSYLQGPKIRKETNKFVHKKWVKEMPYVFTQAEVLLRLHLAMNHLQKF